MRLAATAALCALLLGFPPARSQNPPAPAQNPPDEQAPTIKVDVDLVNVLCSVRDKRGALIGNLGRDDFQVSEEGKQQTIKYFTRETELPLTIGLLVDVSASQANLLDIERQAAYAFFSQVLRKKDEAFLMQFGEEAELLQDFTNSAPALKRGLDQLRINSGVSGIHPGPVPTASQPRGTVLYDAVYLAANEQLSREVGRKVMVLITDGVDQGSRTRLEAAIEAAQRMNAIVYSIYYVDPGAYYSRGFGFGGFGDGALKRMSEETGGRVFKVDRKNTLTDIFNQLQEEMRTQYAIGYSPENQARDGGYRRIEIRARDKNLKVQARKGYYASKAGA
jgi:VWFA-related protein